MNDIKKETGHLNVADAALNRVKKYYSKKKKTLQKKKKNRKHFLKIKMVFLLLKSLHL